MEWKRAGVLAVLLFTMARPAASQTLVVRVFNNFGVPAEELQDARAYAASILEDAGIEVTWMDCWHLDKEAAGASARCGESTGSHEIVLRLQRANARSVERYTSLGFSLVVREGVAFLATVHPDLVESVSRGAGVRARDVLGRAIAHEIGHLLLNTNSHPAAGLMRAAWSRRELRRNAADDWRFLESEALKMREVVAARAPNQAKQETVHPSEHALSPRVYAQNRRIH
jgi:hypothetical protein